MSTTLRRATPVPYPPVDKVRPACRDVDPELFFPEQIGPVNRMARTVCRLCPIQAECVEYALAYDLHGIWGGTSRQERAAMRNAQGIAPLPVLMHAPRLDGAPQTGQAVPRQARRDEIAFPPPAFTPPPPEIRRITPTMPETTAPRFAYDPRRPQITRRRPAASETVRSRPEPSAPVRPRPESVAEVPVVPAEPVIEVAEVVEAAPVVHKEPTKTCPRCREPRTHAEFFTSPGTADGLSPWCKPCFAEVRS
ncbi:WhiB family transcriptional regulator [Microbispora sp. CA-102843]|uniref:WhiB family transcriptional regulator n=1 Tax=Microbispora sp. CA-102843 TaxID=3239952 RepID=UPI003D9435F6